MQWMRGGLFLLIVMVTAVDAAPMKIMRFTESPRLLPVPSGASLTVGKARIERLDDGTLVAVFTDGSGPKDGAWTPEGVFFQPADVFVAWSRDEGSSWSSPLNISNTANQTDKSTIYDPDGIGPLSPRPFYGNVGKPTIFSSGGQQLVVTWSSHWCGTGSQGRAEYSEFGGVQVPYACVYAARLRGTGAGLELIGVDRLTDGSRDALDPVVRATSAGWGLLWQEDPQGLQLGEGDGPGEGDSGAKVSDGTDIWYSYLGSAQFSSTSNPWSAPVALSHNFDYEAGTAIAGGASRANLALVGRLAVVAYEQGKAKGHVGKYVVYQSFPFDGPLAGNTGTIISDPAENARRVRFLTQSTPGPSGLRFFVFWRQGLLGQGGPADVVGRLGRVPDGVSTGSTPTAGFRAEDLFPAVDPTTPANNQPALNLTAAGLTDSTGADPEADARAHRALMRGDLIVFGYTQTASQSLARVAAANYNFFVRRSTDGGLAWSEPLNLSRLPVSETVIEPRLVGTPPTIAGSTDPNDVRNPDRLVAAWTVAVNEDASLGLPTISRDLVATRSSDQGATFEVPTALARGNGDGSVQNAEIQLRANPGGNRVDMLWIHSSAGDSVAWYANSREGDADCDLAVRAQAARLETARGRPFTARFEISNRGRYDATAVTIAIAVPESLAGWLQSATVSGAPASCKVSSTAFNCRVARIPAGGQATLDLAGTALSDEGAEIRVSAVTADQIDIDTVDNTGVLRLDSAPSVSTDSSSGGGGCVLAPGNAFDPTLPVLVVIAGLWIAGTGLLSRRN